MSDQNNIDDFIAGQSFYWNINTEGSWDSASSWQVGQSGSPAVTTPGVNDNVYISSNYGYYYTFVDGFGQSNSLTLGFGVALNGQFSTDTLTSVGDDLRYQTELTSGSSLTTATASVAGGFKLVDAVMTVSGSLIIQNVYQTTSSPFSILNGSTLEVQSLTIGFGGDIVVDTTSAARVGLNDILHQGYLTVSSGSDLLLTGTSVVTGAVWNDGLVEVNNPVSAAAGTDLHSADIYEDISGTGSIQLDASSLLALTGTDVTTSQTITFNGQNAQLSVGDTEATTGTGQFSIADLQHIVGFDSSDDILFDQTITGFTYTINDTASATVDIDVQSNDQTGEDEFTFLGDYTGRSFYAVSGDSNVAASAFTVSAVPCFCPGTMITTAYGDVPVENLAIGDLVLTSSGQTKPILWIGRRSYPYHLAIGRTELQPVLIRASALGGGLPKRDLWLSPKHALLVRDLLVPAELLVNGISVLRKEIENDLSYLHIELEDHDLLLAEGTPAESFVDDDSRSMFDNAADYATLYPARLSRPQAWCAPRVEHGDELLAAQCYVENLVGLADRDPLPKLIGHLDEVGPHCLRGWAWCPDYPDAPVLLDVLADEAVVGQVLAARFRADLFVAGIGTGCHAFEVTPPSGARSLSLRRSLDGAPLAD